MTTMKLLTPVALVAALALAATPAQAQHRSGGGGGGQRSGGQRSGGSQRSASRGGPSGPRVAQRGYPVYRSGGYRVVGPRVYYGGGSRFYSPYYSFRPRVSLGLGLWLGYPVTYPYYYGYPYGYPYPPDPYAYGYAGPSYGYPARPYTSSNQSQYPSSNDDPNYDPDYRPDYGPSGQNYPAQQSAPSIGVQRGDQSAPGGVSFQITPDDAAVFVDGTYIGTAGEFSPTSQPLGLVSGHHRIEIRASGYRTMTFDTDITPGQVLPYQGTLQRN